MVVYDYYLSDQAPAIIYSPYRDGPIAGGWNSTYSLQDTVTWSQDTLGPGISSHITTYPSSTAFFNFTGTDSEALGTADHWSDYEVLCDGKPIGVKEKWQEGILGRCNNDTLGWKSITIVSNTSDTLVFSGFRIFTELPASEG
jgi:hypothetical protein